MHLQQREDCYPLINQERLVFDDDWLFSLLIRQLNRPASRSGPSRIVGAFFLLRRKTKQ